MPRPITARICISNQLRDKSPIPPVPGGFVVSIHPKRFYYFAIQNMFDGTSNCPNGASYRAALDKRH
ncbi:hypothetical protein KL86PLE_41141 [uncultured Pleomorphomonas sp.]|uniref:Uncharacterized protein n=1 Tax=uncultured Pleomorphomonas sp. TaxID=442121 RepID=A0A212LIF9_9HYPH|nr:hypothetical protein KL86PLE_41141 [uncultured Pleomorphomonas sp.]